MRGQFVLPNAARSMIAGSAKRENLDPLAQRIRWITARWWQHFPPVRVWRQI